MCGGGGGGALVALPFQYIAVGGRVCVNRMGKVEGKKARRKERKKRKNEKKNYTAFDLLGYILFGEPTTRKRVPIR